MPLQQPRIAGKQLAAKLKEGKFIWGTAVVLVVFWLIAYHLPNEWLPSNEFKEHVRWYGIFLEVASILSIAYEFNKSLIAAGRRPLLTSFVNWIFEWRFIFVRGKTVNLQAHAHLGTTVSVGTAVIRADLKGTVEERLARLATLVKDLEDRLGTLESKVDTNDRNFREMFESAKAEHVNQITALRGRLEEQHFGDVRLQVAATLVLVLSIFFANAPDESAIFFKAAGLGGQYW